MSDIGLVITLDKKKELFTPFDRLGTESKAIKGKGIRLIISKCLLKRWTDICKINFLPFKRVVSLFNLIFLSNTTPRLLKIS
jgi:hypothetical protein